MIELVTVYDDDGNVVEEYTENVPELPVQEEPDDYGDDGPHTAAAWPSAASDAPPF